MLWYPYFTVLFFVLVVSKERGRAHEFCCAFALSFFLGVLVVYLFPSLGPCFSAPELFGHAAGTKSAGLQQALWQMKLALRTNPHDPNAIHLFSGLPSLHFTVTLIGTYYLRYVHWSLCAASALFCAGTLLSTIYLGWHFVADDIAALPLATLAVLLARRFSWSPWRWLPTGDRKDDRA